MLSVRALSVQPLRTTPFSCFNSFSSSSHPNCFLLLDRLVTGVVEWIVFSPTSETSFSAFREREEPLSMRLTAVATCSFHPLQPKPPPSTPPAFLQIKESFVSALRACQREAMHNAQFSVCLIWKKLTHWLRWGALGVGVRDWLLVGRS